MEAAAEETLEVFGKIHVLVNNAGVTYVTEHDRLGCARPHRKA